MAFLIHSKISYLQSSPLMVTPLYRQIYLQKIGDLSKDVLQNNGNVQGRM